MNCCACKHPLSEQERLHRKRNIAIARNYGVPDPPVLCTLCLQLREALALQERTKKILEDCKAIAAERKNDPGWDANGCPTLEYP